jgi:hypothetical protein
MVIQNGDSFPGTQATKVNSGVVLEIHEWDFFSDRVNCWNTTTEFFPPVDE